MFTVSLGIQRIDMLVAVKNLNSPICPITKSLLKLLPLYFVRNTAMFILCF